MIVYRVTPSSYSSSYYSPRFWALNESDWLKDFVLHVESQREEVTATYGEAVSKVTFTAY